MYKTVRLPASLAKEIPWNKLYVDVTGTYKISSKAKNTDLIIH